jgi:hypothetical protein
MHFKEYDYLFFIALFADLVLLACLILYYFHPAYNFFNLALVAMLYIPVQFGCLILLLHYKQEAKNKEREQFIEKISAQYANEVMEEIQLEKKKIADAHAALIKELEVCDEKPVRYTSALSKRYCSSLLLNALFEHKMALAKRENIEFSLNVNVEHIPEDKENMVISLFANLIDNAFYACRQNPEHKVHLEACVIKKVLMIHIKNTVAPGIQVNLEKSSKEQSWKHGYGLRTIKEILIENDGSLSYSQKKDVFYQDVRLYLSQNTRHNAGWFKKVFVKEKGSAAC